MEGFLIAVLFVLAFVNLGLTIFLLKKDNDKDPTVDIEVLQINMEEFIANMEKENNELYEKMIKYIKERETFLEKRISCAEEKLSAESNSVKVEEISDDDSSASLDEKNEEESIIQLHKQGFSTKQIAKILQMEIGEVELYVNMITTKQGKRK